MVEAPSRRIAGLRNRGWVLPVIFGGLALAFLLLSAAGVLTGRLSLTYDEPQHFRYGEQILEGNAERFDDSKMPISALNVLAARMVAAIADGIFENEWQVMSSGRMATIAFSLGVAVLCATWAWQLGGPWAGALAFGLYVFEPNILAHSALITTDIYAAGTITLTLYVYWRFLEGPSWKRATLLGAAFGLSLIAKYTGIVLFLLIPLLAILRYQGALRAVVRTRLWKELGRSALKAFGYAALVLVLAGLVVNLGFLFHRTGTPFGDYDLRSPQLRALQETSAVLREMPVLLPYPFLDGLDRVLYNERTGENYGRIYLLGELREGEGFLGYFLVASLFKVPLGLLALFGVGLWDWAAGLRRRRPEWARTYLLIPIAVFALYFNFLFAAQIGLRFLLVAFPPALVFTAQVVRRWDEWGRTARVGFAALCAYAVLSVLSYFPDFIPYFNELVPDRRMAYRILSDSNISWGQSNTEVDEVLAQHPEYLFEPEEPVAGTIVVGVNRLVGVLGDPEEYRWLRDNFTPTGEIRYTHLIFEISPEQLGALGLPQGAD